MAIVDIAVDFMVVECGYAARLLTPAGRPRQGVLAAAKEHDVVVVAINPEDFEGHRERYGQGMPPAFTTGAFEATGQTAEHGCVVLDCRQEFAAPWGVVADLMKLRHCGFFDWGALYEHTYDRRKRTLRLKFDTESG